MKPQKMKTIDEVAWEVVRRQHDLLDKRNRKIRALVEHREHLSDESRQLLTRWLQRTINDATTVLVLLNAPKGVDQMNGRREAVLIESSEV